MTKGIYTVAGQRRLSHKRYLPWDLSRSDSWDSIAGALRAMSTAEQGGNITAAMQTKMDALAAHLAKHNMVVDYDKATGFQLVPRDPAIDDPDLPIRRP